MNDNTTSPNTQNHQHRAENDAFLFALRAELPHDFAADLYARLTQEEQIEPMVTNIAPSNTLSIEARIDASLPDTSKRYQRRYMGNGVALIAACALLILCSLIVVLAPRPSSSLSDQPAMTIADAKPITADNADSLTRIMTLGKGNIESIAWSPDGATLAVAGSTGIHLHDADDLNMPSVLLGGKAEATSSISYSPDGVLLAGIRGGDLWIWNATTGTVINRIERVERLVRFNADSTQIAGLTCAFDQNHDGYCEHVNLVIWNMADGTVIDNTLTDLSIDKIALSADFARLIYGVYEDNELVLYDRASGHQIAMPIANTGSYVDIALSDDGYRLVIFWLGPIRFELHTYDLANFPEDDTGLEVFQVTVDSATVNGFVTYMTFLPNSHQLLIASEDIRVYDLDTDQVMGTLAQAGNYVADFVSHPDQPWVAYVENNSRVVIANWKTGERFAENTDYGAFYKQVVFTPDDQRVIGLAFPGLARQWDLSTEPPAESLLFDDVALSESLVYLAYTQQNGLAYIKSSIINPAATLHLVDQQTGENLIVPSSIAPSQFAFSTTADGRLMSVDTYGAIKLWTAENPPQVVLMEGKPELNYLTSAVATISPDGKLTATSVCIEEHPAQSGNLCSKSAIKLWNTETGDLLANLEESDYPLIRAMKFSADSRYLAAGNCGVTEPAPAGEFTNVTCSAPRIALWDIHSVQVNPDQPAALLSIPIFAVLPDFTSQPEALVFSPLSSDGHLLIVTGSYTDGMKLWQVNTSTGVTELLRESDLPTQSVSFNSTGTLLAVGSGGIVELWGTDQ